MRRKVHKGKADSSIFVFGDIGDILKAKEHLCTGNQAVNRLQSLVSHLVPLRILGPLIKQRNEFQKACFDLFKKGVRCEGWKFDPVVAKTFRDSMAVDLTVKKRKEDKDLNSNKAYERDTLEFEDTECDVCHNCLYLLNVRCKCNPAKVHCFRHVPDCCNHSQKWFEIRHTLGGLDKIVYGLILKISDDEAATSKFTSQVDHSLDKEIIRLRREAAQRFQDMTWPITVFQSVEDVRKACRTLEPYIWAGGDDTGTNSIQRAYSMLDTYRTQCETIDHAYKVLITKKNVPFPPK